MRAQLVQYKNEYLSIKRDRRDKMDINIRNNILQLACSTWISSNGNREARRESIFFLASKANETAKNRLRIRH